MGEPIEQCGGHLGIAENAGPFAEAQVRGDNDAGVLVERTEQVEEQGATRGAERQVSQFVKDDEVGIGEDGRDLADGPAFSPVRAR